MAHSFQTTLLSFLFIFSITQAQPSFRPTALVVPVKKDASTLQYVTTVNQRTPLVSTNLVIDLGGRFLWVDCDQNYVSSTYRPLRCRTSQCSLAGSIACGDCFDGPRPGCNNNTCGVFPENPVINTATGGEVAEDVISVQSTDGSSAGRLVTVPRFIFSCAPTFLLQNLASGVTGMAGLGRTRIALPSQFASAFSFNRKFAMCLSGSTSSNGVIIFGNDPYKFLPNIILSDQALTYTPLLINPVSTGATSTQGEPSVEYFIGVKSIKINSKTVSLNTSLLSISSEGNGGTKISTIKPYSVLETSIYKAVTEAFIKESAARNITRVASVAPFGACFSTNNVGSTRVGPSVPYIDLVLQSESVVWTITGSNSMVYVNDNVLCLGVVDGGSNPRTSIVIGGHQLEDNLLQFDLATSRLGFSSTLLGRRTTCANFNFTSTA
ncbi:Basic 7S globulin [Heracleum sosnowskyi]|uniref:Basic 7S globulin n=1 Tax=Heracleum sosnowskyi TaxID=360622 RepID=A0AAD8HUF2_9APIA|nr:Basic 7S globulin [Heracleum sosnowskyi]